MNMDGTKDMEYLSLRSVAKTFAGVAAVKDFSLEIAKGALVAFLGPSGCGKTTTLRMIAGFEEPDPGSGRVYLDGADITELPSNRRDIGMVFQSYALFPNMTVWSNVAFGLEARRLDKREIGERVGAALDMVRLRDADRRFPHQLSGGQQQRIALARALAIRPRVLLLDEPLSALDAEVRLALRGEIRRIQSELAITTVYVTHDQEEALSISDKVVVMNRGVVEQVGTPEEIYHRPKTRFVAGFIGTANQFTGKAVGENEVACEGFTIAAPVAAQVGEASLVVVLVRPETIAVHDSPPEEGGGNVIEGVIETVTFHGAVTRLGIDAKGQRLSADVTMGEKKRFSLNQRVWLSFDPESCQVMAREEGPG
ncbi:MAG TPA: ABC transporter ATP-binding protein [Rectinemataceae bacterium]|nr:ABC transporter ATP-binding protein [Rectinemataceae bacterium]